MSRRPACWQALWCCSATLTDARPRLTLRSHLDTWNGRLHLGSWSPTSEITHGSFFWQAAREGLISNTSSIHAGIRTRLSDFSDLTDDADSGFMLLTTDDIDDLGADGIAEAIIRRVGDAPCYLR